MADLPLSGKRWIWILVALLVVILIGVIVSTVPRSYEKAGSQPVEDYRQQTGESDGTYVPGMAPADSPAPGNAATPTGTK